MELTGALRSAVGGEAHVDIEAATIRELLGKLTERYPKLAAHVEDPGVSVSINGQIFRDNWGEAIPEDAEVFVLPRLQGG